MTSKAQKRAGYPTAEPLDDGSRICVTFEIPNQQPYRSAVTQHLHELGHWWNWKKDYKNPNRKATDTAELFRRLLFQTLRFGDCEDCPDMLDFRQNPTNSCLLQYSHDGGDTWVDMFDYSLCIPNSTDQEISNFGSTGTAELNRLRTTYNGTPQSIYTNGTWDGGGDSATRNDVLCYASWAFVNACCEAGIKALDNEEARRDTLFQIASIAIGLAAAVVSFFGSLGNPVLAAGVGLAVMSAAFAAFALADNVGVGILDDEETKQKVVCCMYEGLEGSTPDFTNWQNSVSNCEFDSGSDEEKLRLYIESMLSDQDLYLTFLQAMQDAFTLIQAGIPQPGSCECPIEINIVPHLYACTVTRLGGNRWRVSAGCTQGTPDTKRISFIEETGQCFRVIDYTANINLNTIPSSQYELCSGGFANGNVPDNTCMKRANYLCAIGCSAREDYVEFTVVEVC